MDDPVAARARSAATARQEEIANYVHDPSPQVVGAVLENPGLTEEHVLAVANRKNLPAETLEAIFRDKRWSESYPVKLALARNPKTPLFTALSIARFLRLFDLAELARSRHLPVLYRKKVEAIVIEKIPTLPLGVKKTLAKVASGDILLALIQDGYPEVVRTCLDNPSVVESHLYKVISRKTTTAGTIRTIAEHRGWRCRYHIKFALIRNEHTPLGTTVLFLTDLKLYDLRELYRDPFLPSGVRPAIHRELLERGEDPEKLDASDADHIYEIDENEDRDNEKEPDDAGELPAPDNPSLPGGDEGKGTDDADRSGGPPPEQT